ncbi:MAG: DUF192 domain-containing protein [Firmicutes bacterium]|nr:DUF192 domain-containing protein [Bacillota bacterium]
MAVRNERTGAWLATAVDVAGTAAARLRGLLGREALAPGEGLLLFPCNAVHGLGMRFDLDVLHLDRRGRVLRVVHLRRHGLGPLVRGGYFALELPAGTAAATGTQPGDELRFLPADALKEA